MTALRRLSGLLAVSTLAACAAGGSGPATVGPPPNRPGEAVTTWREPLVVNPGYRIYMRNNLDVSIRIKDLIFYDCYNVRQQCDRAIDPNVELEPGGVERVAVVRPQRTDERWTYRYRYAFERIR